MKYSVLDLMEFNSMKKNGYRLEIDSPSRSRKTSAPDSF
jgi:hypothetical protein